MAKQKIQIIASEETYKNLQTFADISELNEAVRAHKERFKDDLTKSAVKVLDLLHRYSAKYTGVSFLLKNTIAKELEISRRTVIRACQQLESLGIIRQYEMKRKTDMMQTSNAIVIQPITDSQKRPLVQGADTQESPKVSHPKNNISLKQNININHLNNKRSPYIKFVPKSLQHFQAIFGKRVKDLYGRIWLAAKKLDVSVDQKTMQEIGFIAMDKLKQYVKEGRQLSTEQECSAAYTIAHNQLTQRLEIGEIIDWSHLYTYLEKNKIRRSCNLINKASRKELNELGIF
jgi:DNA-binding Lrp family transcriptional regulator